MALPALIGGGAECGPSNPLQGLSKRFDADRGVQQDHFGGSRAGSSREVFRSQGNTLQDQDAARFFSGNTSSIPHFAPDAGFDLSAMHAALPGVNSHQQYMQLNPASAWASDFMQQPTMHSPPAGQMSSSMSPVQQMKEDQALTMRQSPISAGGHMSMGTQWTPGVPGLSAFRTNSMPAFMPQMPMHQTPQPAIVSKRISWDKEFNAQELQLSTSSTILQEPEQKSELSSSQRSAHESDELARTAGLLLDNVKHEQNIKFQNSQFMGLMKQLRDGEMIVQGNDMVESDGQTSAQAAGLDVKGKGRALNAPPAPAMLNSHSQLHPHLGFAPLTQQNADQQHQQQNSEDPLDAYFRQDNQDYINYWNDPTVQQPHVTAEGQHWDRLQYDWDSFEASSSGIRAATHYRFQEDNPYLVGDSTQTQHHLMHQSLENGSVWQGVLEREAIVQQNPNNASAWYELGVKQQENEREHKALQALQRAVELDPTHLPSWLALAISYTNDNNRQSAYDAIYEWVSRNPAYSGAVDQFRQSQMTSSTEKTLTEKYGELIQCLIMMARSSTSGDIDADIQIALAVLLNTNEEYSKATDCFRTALAVRPEDWLLYNRVGATMANSGRAEEALDYYYRALELNPGYIRARFNLGISCINLRRYDEAAHHILDALELQESDGSRDNAYPPEERGAASTALWDSLKTTCLHMQRADLAGLCDMRNVDVFRRAFFGE